MDDKLKEMLQNILNKGNDVISDDERGILRARRSYLTPEQIKMFHIEDEVVVEEKKEEVVEQPKVEEPVATVEVPVVEEVLQPAPVVAEPEVVTPETPAVQETVTVDNDVHLNIDNQEPVTQNGEALPNQPVIEPEVNNVAEPVAPSGTEEDEYSDTSADPDAVQG